MKQRTAIFSRLALLRRAGLLLLGALLCTVLAAAPAQAQPAQETAEPDTTERRFDIGVQAVGGLQLLNQSNDGNTLPKVASGFQSAAGNLTIDAKITDGIDVYAELYLSSPNHVGDVYDREGYIYVEKLPDFFGSAVNSAFQYIDIKAGHMELNFGDQRMYRSDVAQVQENPLFGNYIVDPNTIGIGTEVYGYVGPVMGMVGYNSGATTGDFTDKRGNAFLAKAAVGRLDDPYRLAGSFYRVDQSRNGPGFPASGSSSNLFSGNFSGSRYEAILGGGASAGQLELGGGQDVTAFQFDGKAQPISSLTVRGLFGWFEDADTNGSIVNSSLGRTGDDGNPTDRWIYYGVTAEQYITDRFYVAGRYNAAAPQELQSNEDLEGSVQRVQLGGGFWIVQDQLLVKGEYVNQWASDFTSGVAFNGVDYSTDPRFYGAVFEVSANF
jgi:hypothetical protein